MPTPKQTSTAQWVRVRLATAGAPGQAAALEGELVLRADRVAVDAEQMLFFVADEEVFRLDRKYFRSMAWFVDRPTFAERLRSRRAHYPAARKPWDADESKRLAMAIGAGVDWEKIALAHGRTVAAVRAKATALGFVGNRVSGG